MQVLKAWMNGNRMLPPWLALVILLGLQLGSLPFLLNIHFNNAADIYSPSDAPIIQLRESLFREFHSDEALIAIIESKLGDNFYVQKVLKFLQGTKRGIVGK